MNVLFLFAALAHADTAPDFKPGDTVYLNVDLYTDTTVVFDVTANNGLSYSVDCDLYASAERLSCTYLPNLKFVSIAESESAIILGVDTSSWSGWISDFAVGTGSDTDVQASSDSEELAKKVQQWIEDLKDWWRGGDNCPETDEENLLRCRRQLMADAMACEGVADEAACVEEASAAYQACRGG